MKAPRPAGAPVDQKRMDGWLDDFSGYRHSVTAKKIEFWLSQFDLPDIDLAARVLDVVDFVRPEQVSNGFRAALQGLPGWAPEAARRRGQWRFVAYGASAGESGDAMLHRFRQANGLGSSSNGKLFAYRSELLRSGLKRGDTIVMVDDFSESGSQIVKTWPAIKEILPDGPQVQIILAAATSDAIRLVRETTGIGVHANILLQKSDEVFANECTRFSDAEKARLKDYCGKLGGRTAEFSKDGHVIVFAHGCPNNTLPILHSAAGGWTPLFPRRD